MNIGAFFVLAYWVNLLSASLTLAATLFYLLVYTGWLKRNTPQNIVIGGAAGSIPPMVGWAAVTGGIDLPALYLFSIVFFWTPPHFWALALLIQKDYEAAGVPMLPVVAGKERTTQNIFIYSLALVALTLLFAATDAVGLVYLASATVLGAVFIVMAWNLKREQTTRKAKHLYLYSLLYLALLFAVMLGRRRIPVLDPGLKHNGIEPDPMLRYVDSPVSTVLMSALISENSHRPRSNGSRSRGETTLRSGQPTAW